MDRPKAAKKWRPRRIALYGASTVATAVIVSLAVGNSGKTRASVDTERLSVSQVHRAQFEEYVPVNGKVQPNTAVFLDLAEGGIVEKVYVQSGSPVKQGELILSFANNAAQKENIETETRLLENLDQLRNSKISLTTSNLVLKDQLLDNEHRIHDLETRFGRYDRLMKVPNPALSREDFENTRDQLAYERSKRELLLERIKRESELEQQQSSQIDDSIVRVNRNLELLGKIAESLEVRAPVSGQLSALTAEVGQSFARGARVGQIDQLDSLKAEADVDQYYISKVALGQSGRFEMDGRQYEVKVSKIYPEVTNDVFKVDFAFVGELPPGIKRGQTLQIDLALSQASETNIVDKGGFYRHTNGRWVYLVAENGRSARRMDVVLGRENPQSVEVLQGLKPGDWVITSSYDGLNDVDELKFGNSIIPR